MRFCRVLLSVIVLTALAVGTSAQNIIGQGRIADTGLLEVNYLTACRDAQGNHYITGVTGGQGESGLTSGEIVTQKVSSAGAILWTHTFSYPPYSMCYPDHIAVAANGDAFIAGHATNIITNTTSLLVFRISSLGSTVWDVVFGAYSAPSGLALDATENPYIAVTDAASIVLVKLNEVNGAVLWAKPQSDGTITQCSGLATSSGGALFALLNGTTKPSEVLAVNESTGATIWTRPAAPYGVLASESWSRMAVLSSGNVAVGGAGSSAGATYTVAAIDWIAGATGTFLHRTTLGAETAKYATSFTTALATDGSSNVYWSASQTDSATKAVIQDVGKYSAAGTLDWSYDIPSATNGILISQANDGGMFVSYIESARRYHERLSSTGVPVWTVSPTTVVSAAGGQLIVDAQDDLSYLNSVKDAYGNTYFGLLSLAAANGSVSVNGYETPTGDRSNTISGADQDEEGNAYATGLENRGWFVEKLSPSGAVIWRKTVPAVTTASPAAPYNGLICYYNGEVAAVAMGGPDPEKLIVTKLNATTGAFVWTAVKALADTSAIPQSIKIDVSGNVDVGLNDYVDKFGAIQFSDVSGVVNWLTWETADTPNGIIALDAKGDVFLSGSFWYSQSPSLVLVKLSQKGESIFSNPVFLGSGPFVSSLQCDPLSGDVLLEASDSVLVGANILGAVDVARYGPTGDQIWANTINAPTGYGYAGPTDAKFRSANGMLYMVTNLAASVGESVDYGVECVSALTGKLVWQRVFNVTNNLATYIPTPWNLDQYGDVIFTTPVPGTSRILNRFQTIKLDAATGGARFQTLYNGTFASTFNEPTSVVVGPDAEPLILGFTSSPVGPGSNDSFQIKYVDAHGPICFNDAYTCAENTALPATAPSVFANDRDIAGATCYLVKSPTHAKTFALSAAGKITYTPATNFVGKDTFTYDASNPYGTSNVATVTITVG